MLVCPLDDRSQGVGVDACAVLVAGLLVQRPERDLQGSAVPADNQIMKAIAAAIAASLLTASCASAAASAEPATMDPDTTAIQGVSVVDFVREQAPEAAAATLGSDEEIFAHLQRIIAAAQTAIAQGGECQLGFNSYLKGALSRETELNPDQTYNRSTTYFFAAYLATDRNAPEGDWLFSCFDSNGDGKQDRMPGLNPLLP